MKSSVIFVCFHNSARSQMAEAILRHLCPDEFSAESAGIEAGKLNPLAVQVMSEIGIDISANPTRRIFDVVRSGKVFWHVISLCDEASEGRCPVVLRYKERHHWPFADPAVLEGSAEERLAKTREIRDQIYTRIQEWCRQSRPAAPALC
jgi:arsenate reductase